MRERMRARGKTAVIVGAGLLCGMSTGVLAQDAPEAPVAKEASGEQGASTEALKARVAQLERENERLRGACQQSSEAQTIDRDELAVRLRGMKAARAAHLLAALDVALSADLLQRLDRRTSGRILSKMPTKPAAAIVAALAKRTP